jgi:D-alanyl-lipoteichoic acid acyltransferase DltB (MBOAT superfamily)
VRAGAGGYALGLGLCTLAMECLTHWAPVWAVAQSGAYRDFTPLELLLFCFVMLKMLWLKFFIIWRFFRLWAVLDGVDTPENMTRWMTDNYSLQVHSPLVLAPGKSAML